jgi:hypothetical protein
MQEICTYGLMRGCWAARDAAAVWGLLDLIARNRRGGEQSR